MEMRRTGGKEDVVDMDLLESSEIVRDFFRSGGCSGLLGLGLGFGRGIVKRMMIEIRRFLCHL